MEGNNNAPFFVGQKVVRIGRTCDNIIHGEVYTVSGILKCKCNKWRISLLEDNEGFDNATCKNCGNVLINNEGWLACYFAPLEKREHSIYIDKEVFDSLPKITEERSDVKPQTVNNQDMEKVNLTKTITQIEQNSNKVQSELLITVEYDPKEKVVTQVICLHVREPQTNMLIDVTAIIAEHFDDSLEKHLEAADWWEIYRAEQEAKKEAA